MKVGKKLLKDDRTSELWPRYQPNYCNKWSLALKEILEVFKKGEDMCQVMREKKTELYAI